MKKVLLKAAWIITAAFILGDCSEEQTEVMERIFGADSVYSI